MATFKVDGLEWFETYFNEDFTSQSWIRNPFIFISEVPDDVVSVLAKESFRNLISDGGWKLKFQSTSLFSFWLATYTEYQAFYLSSQALKFLMLFSTTYLCETGLSAITGMKNKDRSLLNIDLRLKLTKNQLFLEESWVK